MGVVVLPLHTRLPSVSVRHEQTDVAFPLAMLYSMTMIGSIGGGWFLVYYLRKAIRSTTAVLKVDADDRHHTPGCAAGATFGG